MSAQSGPAITRRSACAGVASLPLLAAAAAGAAEAPPEGQWDLSELFADAAAWTASLRAVTQAVDSLAALQKTATSDPRSLQAALQAISDAGRQVGRLSTYATLVADADATDSAAQEGRQLATALAARLATATAWLKPQVIALGSDGVDRYVQANPGLAKFRFQLAGILRGAPHTLDAAGEELLSKSATVLADPQAIRTQLAVADMPRRTAKLRSGDRIIDDQAFTALRDAPDQADRQAVFQALFGQYKAFESTFGAALSAQIHGDVFKARARGFPSALAARFFPDAIPEAVYRTLVAETEKGLPSLHRYFEIRRRRMGLAQLGYHDLYPPLAKLDRRFSLADARSMALAAVAPLGQDYVRTLGAATAARWMDAYPRRGKLGGAYSNPGAYDVHPYLLLNYTGSYDSASTFAHEWGHAMHALMASRSQPYETSGYAVFISEIASTLNEQLLVRHMVQTAASDAERLFYLNALVELYRGTYFRQVMFAEFELAIHEAAERGEALSGARFSALYLALLRKYHGPAVEMDPLYAAEWAYVPHFFRNFYVYQYATSLAASAYFAENILSGAPRARAAYLGVLQAGASDYPVAILRRAGLDMTRPDPYRALIARFDRALDEMERLMARGA